MADASKTHRKFPQVEGGGSLILAWQVKDRDVLVVGGGEVAAGRILNLLNADARVTVVCPSAGLNAEVAYRVAENQILHIDRKFLESDLDAVPRPTPPTSTSTSLSDECSSPPAIPEQDRRPCPAAPLCSPPCLVLVAIDDPSVSSSIWRACQRRGLPANIADVPPQCDFYFGSVHRQGPIQIMVSTNGNGPRLAAAIRSLIASTLPAEASQAVKNVGRLRAMLRRKAPQTEMGGLRMRWMSRVSDGYGWGELSRMGEGEMSRLVEEWWPKGEVPGWAELTGEVQQDREKEGEKEEEEEKEGVVEFDGSFGFSVGG